jgi:hypothetical protein
VKTSNPTNIRLLFCKVPVEYNALLLMFNPSLYISVVKIIIMVEAGSHEHSLAYHSSAVAHIDHPLAGQRDVPFCEIGL